MAKTVDIFYPGPEGPSLYPPPMKMTYFSFRIESEALIKRSVVFQWDAQISVIYADASLPGFVITFFCAFKISENNGGWEVIQAKKNWHFVSFSPTSDKGDGADHFMKGPRILNTTGQKTKVESEKEGLQESLARETDRAKRDVSVRMQERSFHWTFCRVGDISASWHWVLGRASASAIRAAHLSHITLPSLSFLVLLKSSTLYAKLPPPKDPWHLLTNGLILVILESPKITI